MNAKCLRTQTICTNKQTNTQKKMHIYMNDNFQVGSSEIRLT